MPSTNLRSTLHDWLAGRNVSIVTAIVIAIPTAYAFHVLVDTTTGDFLLLMTLGVGVPMVYDEYWSPHDRPWRAAAWVVLACGVATVVFTGLYLVGTMLLRLDPFLASVGAFLLTFLGPFVVFSFRRSR